MKNRIDSSRRRTPWDKDSNLTAIQKFIIDKYNNRFYDKHPKLSETDEADIINSAKITNCRYCGSENIRKNGFTQNGIQRYSCKDCNRKFLPTIGTIFDDYKISITE